MTRNALLAGVLLVIVLATLTAGGLWGYSYSRRIDGRSATAWLALAERAGRQVSYHAEGSVVTRGIRARFTLDQGHDGCYTIVTRDADGRQSTIGYDGHQLWYASGDNRQSITTASPSAASSPLLPSRSRRILGTTILAARPAVRLAIASGPHEKVLDIDRQTGVVLGMTSLERHHPVSDMRVQRIDYRAVPVTKCTRCAATSYETKLDNINRLLGEQALQPAWLPDGVVAAGCLVGKCPMCGHNMAILRYSDGLTAMTLFEMPLSCGCSMGEGCYQAEDAHEIILHHAYARMNVTLVGNLDQRSAEKVLNHLR